jgi:diguanylate cyclase (GGDEF)-like protein/PAS domain S-box-containing protein
MHSILEPDDAVLEPDRLAIESADAGVWDWHIAEDRIAFSPRMKVLLGVADLDESVAAWFARIHHDDLPEVERALTAHVEGRTAAFEVEYRIHDEGGGERWLWTRAVARRNGAGEALRMVGLLTDVTARKEEQARLRHDAYHDEGTGLPNRTLLLDHLRRAIATQEERRRPFAVVALALDNYDPIVDSYGHEVCEEWTSVIAARISALAGPIDTLARLRKDQLCLLVESTGDLAAVLRLTDAIQQAVQQPACVGGEELFTTVSLGIVSSDGIDREPEDYLHDAVVALNRAFAGGGGRRAVFDLVMHQDVVRRLRLEKDLRRGIPQREFRVLYQPIVSLQTGAVAGFEALLRWQHPERGLLAPGEFLAVAEETGVLSQIFAEIFPEILAQAQRWQQRDRERRAPFVNVNLSRAQLADPDLLEQLDHALARSGVDPHALGFEVTESVMVDDEAILRALRGLKERQVRILLDDFGTGYSCLANMRQFPLDSIKIDKSFIEEVGKAPGAGEIARAIVTLAHGMAFDVTMEGIETEAQLRFAHALGCEYAQGYHFATPLAPEEATAAIRQAYRTSLTPPSSGSRVRSTTQRARVLLIDGYAERRATMVCRLEQLGYKVATAATAHEGIEHAEAELPDLTLVDLDLPAMGSAAVCRRLKQHADTSNMPVLLLAGDNPSAATLEDALAAGAGDCVSTTTPAPLLRARLDAFIAQGRVLAKLGTMAMTDELTGVFSRRFLFQELRRAIKSTAREAPRSLACLVIDPDGFRRLNQARGPIEADRLLQRIASTIDQTTRETDIVARFGGEEFVVLLQGTTRAGAERAAEKIRAAVEHGCATTVSIGGACLPEASIDQVKTSRAVDGVIAELLRRAETAMVAAKTQGKNRVVFHAEREAESA